MKKGNFSERRKGNQFIFWYGVVSKRMYICAMAATLDPLFACSALIARTVDFFYSLLILNFIKGYLYSFLKYD